MPSKDPCYMMYCMQHPLGSGTEFQFGIVLNHFWSYGGLKCALQQDMPCCTHQMPIVEQLFQTAEVRSGKVPPPI